MSGVKINQKPDPIKSGSLAGVKGQLIKDEKATLNVIPELDGCGFDLNTKGSLSGFEDSLEILAQYAGSKFPSSAGYMGLVMRNLKAVIFDEHVYPEGVCDAEPSKRNLYKWNLLMTRFMKNEDALMIMMMTLYTIIWGSTCVLIDTYGVDAVVKDDIKGKASSGMRRFYSVLIQQDGKFKEQLVGDVGNTPIG